MTHNDLEYTKNHFLLLRLFACISLRIPWARTSVIGWIKKAEKLPALSDTVLTPEADDPEATILELDELWSFVLKKANQAWIWIALCRKTRQVVSYARGDRSEKTCRILWEALPATYRAGHCFTDFWAAYQAVIRSASNIQQWARKQVKRHT